AVQGPSQHCSRLRDDGETVPRGAGIDFFRRPGLLVAGQGVLLCRHEAWRVAHSCAAFSLNWIIPSVPHFLERRLESRPVIRPGQGGHLRAMSDQTFTPGPTPNTVRASDGRVLTVPDGWILLPPGDAALTRRVKEAGDHWVVQENKGRKT